MNMTRRDAVSLIGAAVAGAAVAPVPTTPALAEGKRLTFAYAASSDKIPFVVAVGKGIEEAAKAKEIDVIHLDNDADAARAVQNARTVASRKPDLFIEYNLVADSNKQVQAICEDAKIPIVAVQYPIANAPLFIIKNYDAGYESAKAVAEAAKARWGANAVSRALLVNFAEGGPVQLERSAGARAAIRARLKGAQIVDLGDKNDNALARQVVSDALTAAPNQKMIVWVHVDSFALSALAAVRAAGRENDVLIASIGGDPSVFPELRRGHSPYVGTLGLFPETWGADIVDLGLHVLRGQKVPPVSYPAHIAFLTSENLTRYYPAKG